MIKYLLLIFIFTLSGLKLGTQNFDISTYRDIKVDYNIDIIKDIAMYYKQDFNLIKHIFDICGQFDLDPLLLIALIKVESDFIAGAVSSSNAIGYCQIKPIVLEDIGYDLDQYNPSENIMIGAIFLAKLINRYNNMKEALIHYNAGTMHSIREKGIEYAHNVLYEYNTIKIFKERYK